MIIDLILSLLFWNAGEPIQPINSIAFENDDPMPYYSYGHIMDNSTLCFPLKTDDYFVSTHFTKWHQGTDFACDLGVATRASQSGRILFAGWYYGYGNFVVIEHLNGWITRYGHLSKIDVRQGDFVVWLQKIGEVGNTGKSTGSHLHYEIIKDGVFVDPEGVLK